MSEWYENIESTLFTQIAYMLKNADNAPFPNLHCRATNEIVTPAQFPTLYLHEEQEETGQDLENQTVNAVNSTVYIRVWTNTTEYDCKEVLRAATKELKRFRYNVKNLPTAQLNNKIAFGEIMAFRVIGNGDTDIVK